MVDGKMTGVEKLFYITWKLMQLTFLFHLLTILGGVVFGIGPAWETIVTLFLETKSYEKNYSIKRAFSVWKSSFVKANLCFWLFSFIAVFLVFNLYWSIQFQNLLFWMVSFLIMLAIVIDFMMYVYLIFYNAEYDIPFWENIKLSFISVFLSFKQFLLTMLALFGVLVLTWQYKGLYLFLTFGLLVLFLHQVTQPNRQLIDQMIESDQ